MLSKQEMLDKLKSVGLNKTYKPYREEGLHDKDSILLQTRHPVKIEDGIMSGSEIDLLDDQTIRIWTSQKNKANKVARDNGFKIKNFDGEAELLVPIEKTDQFLHAFGAKVKRACSEAQKQALSLGKPFPKSGS